MTCHLPATWPAVRLPIEVARVLLRRQGARAAREFIQSARRQGWRLPTSHQPARTGA